MGDVVGLMKDFEEVVDEKKAAEDAMRMLEGQFTLDDFLEQVRMIQKMGSLKDLVGKMPGMGDMLPADVEPRRPRARADRGDDPVASPSSSARTPTRSSASRARGAHRQGLGPTRASGAASSCRSSSS